MSRLFQPSGLLIPKKGNPKPENHHVRPTDTAVPSCPSSSTPISDPQASKIAQLRPSTVVMESLKYNTNLNIAQRPSTGRTKIIDSNTKITITKTTGEEKVLKKNDRSIFLKGPKVPTKSRVGFSFDARKSAAVPIPPPSLLRREVSLQMKNMASKGLIGAKVTGLGAKSSKVAPLEEIMTPSGPKQVLQKVVTEKRVERTKYGEVVARNITTIGTNLATGETIQMEEEVQKLNPQFPPPKGSIKKIVSVVSERDFTSSYAMTRKNIVQETTKLTLDIGMNKNKVELLVGEETEDVSNILKSVAPELVNQSSELFSLKKRLQQLKLSPENAGLLEKSVISSPISADLPIPEATPDLVATMMSISEKKDIPIMPTEQTFNSLFVTERRHGPVVVVSSASPGPLEDVVIPTFLDEGVHEEILSKQMEQVSALVNLTDKKPSQDGFSRTQPSQPRRRGRRRRPYKALSDEDPPWSNEALLVSIEAVGACPTYSLHPSNILQSVSEGTFLKETSKGVEYILDCEPLQYCSRVQLRGSQPPPWFPGYMVALSDIPSSVELAKSPSEVLLSAWKSVQPKVFPNDSVAYN